MRWVLLLAPLLLCAAATANKKCVRPAEQLYHYSRLPSVSDDAMAKCRDIVDRVPEKCSVGDIVTEIDGEPTCLGSITYLYGRICQRSTSVRGAEYFLKYRVAHWHSADEEFSLSFERVFAAKPEAVLSLVRQQVDSVRVQLLNDIVWGFLTNRVYGAIDPLEDYSQRSARQLRELPPEVLNKHNYRQIFLRLNSTMPEVCQKYAQETDYVLRECQKYLETWGAEY